MRTDPILGLFPSLVDALCMLSHYILQMPLEKRETPWTRVTLLANTRRRSKSHLLCASRQSLQLRKLPLSYALL